MNPSVGGQHERATLNYQGLSLYHWPDNGGVMTECDVCGSQATARVEWVPVGGSRGVEDRVCSVCGGILLDLGSVRDLTVTAEVSTPDFDPSV